MSAARKTRFPRGHFEPVWRDRDMRVADVVFVRDRRPRALNERFFAEQIPVWRARGVAFNIEPTSGTVVAP